MKHYGDITKLHGWDLPIVDVITGGSPCQDLSTANGNRQGLAGERSGLFLEQIRIVKEMREHDRANGRADEFLRPRYMVWENVPGSFSSGNPKGADFQRVLTEIIRIAEPNAPDVPMPTRGGGASRDASSMKWGDGLWLIKSTIADGGECHKDENGLVWLRTLTDSPHGKLYLTLNTGEKPRVENNTHLSQVLQEGVDPKYNLSPKACQGIINRANNRGKALPQVLMDALEEQING